MSMFRKLEIGALGAMAVLDYGIRARHCGGR